MGVLDDMKKDRTHLIKCIVPECTNMVKWRYEPSFIHSGKCKVCASKKPPYVALYNRFLNGAKNENKTVTITFNDFLKYTTVDKCHYCECYIEWRPFYTENNKYVGGSYFLDRMNNDIGYAINNVVVCCERCNKAKGNRYSYEEWYGMTKFFRDMNRMDNKDGVCGV